MNTNTINFLRKYVEENENAFQNAQDYIEHRGFIDAFGIDNILKATATQEFARSFKEIMDAELIEEDEKVEYAVKTIKDALTQTTLFHSSSLGQNAMNVFKLEEAQRLFEKLEWNRALDAHMTETVA